MLTHDTKIRVWYKHTDQMGFVHHSNYICYYEEARSDLMRSMGLSYAEMERRGIIMPILEVHSFYKKPAFFDDELTVRRIVSLAVHRIQDVCLTDHFSTVAVPEPSPGMFGLPWHEPRHFRIRFAPGRAADYVRERIWADEQRLEDLPDGGVLLEITTCSEPELLAWVRSFGDSAELLAGALPAGECSSDRHDGEAL